MAGIVNKEFPKLAQTGLNYLSWSSDCEIFLQGKTLLRAIGKGAQLAVTDPKFETENAQALHFLRHHLSPTLKDEYMAERSASGLWTALKQRFERLKYTVKPRAEAEWIRLRFADFKTVGEYNSALHRICTTLVVLRLPTPRRLRKPYPLSTPTRSSPHGTTARATTRGIQS